jgi:hypothetical protein
MVLAAALAGPAAAIARLDRALAGHPSPGRFSPRPPRRRLGEQAAADGPLVAKPKVQLSLRLDTDVVAGTEKVQGRVVMTKVREPVPRQRAAGKVDDEKPATDIQAVLTVIGRRRPGAGKVDLSYAKIPWADLYKASLQSAAGR